MEMSRKRKIKENLEALSMKTYYIYVNNFCFVRVEETEPNSLHIENVKQLALTIYGHMANNPTCHIAVYKDDTFVEIVKLR